MLKAQQKEKTKIEVLHQSIWAITSILTDAPFVFSLSKSNHFSKLELTAAIAAATVVESNVEMKKKTNHIIFFSFLFLVLGELWTVARQPDRLVPHLQPTERLRKCIFYFYFFFLSIYVSFFFKLTAMHIVSLHFTP